MKINIIYLSKIFIDGPLIRKPITLLNKEALPPYTGEDFSMFLNFKERKPYTIEWLKKDDPLYKIGVAKINMGGGLIRQINLTTKQEIQLKWLWNEYWILKGTNFKDYIFPFITASFGFAVGYYLKSLSC